MEIQLIPLTIGITQLIKEWFGLSGKRVQMVAVAVTYVTYIVLRLPVYFPQVSTVVQEVVTGLAYALAAIGFYNVGTKEIAGAIAKALGSKE